MSQGLMEDDRLFPSPMDAGPPTESPEPPATYSTSGYFTYSPVIPGLNNSMGSPFPGPKR